MQKVGKAPKINWMPAWVQTAKIEQ